MRSMPATGTQEQGPVLLLVLGKVAALKVVA